MLKVLIRCSVLVSMLLLLVMVDAYELQRDDAYPDGAQQRILLSMTQSDLPREQVLEGLASIPENGEWIAKAVPDPEDFMGRRSLAVFGPGGTHTGPVDWYSTRITGEHLSPEQLGDANLSGLYYAQLSEDSLNSLRAWAQPHQITVEVDTVGLPAVLYQTVIGNGFGFSLLACVIIVVVGLLAWVVNRSTVRVVRTVSGVPSPRLHRLELLQLGRMLLPWMAVLWLAGVGLVAVARGAENAASFAGTSALATLAFILGLAVIYGILVWWSTPTRQIISQRRPAVQGQFGLSAGLKLLGLLVVVVSIPVTVASLVATVGLVTGESRWSTFGEDVGIRVTTASEEEFQDTKDAFQRLVAEQEIQGNLDVAYSFTPEPLGLEDFGPYDGVILVNGAFAQRWEDMDAAALRSIPVEEADAHVVEMVEESLPLWVQDGRGLQDLQLRVVADPDAAGEVPVLSSTGTAELQLMRHPPGDGGPGVFGGLQRRFHRLPAQQSEHPVPGSAGPLGGDRRAGTGRKRPVRGQGGRRRGGADSERRPAGRDPGDLPGAAHGGAAQQHRHLRAHPLRERAAGDLPAPQRRDALAEGAPQGPLCRRRGVGGRGRAVPGGPGRPARAVRVAGSGRARGLHPRGRAAAGPLRAASDGQHHREDDLR